MGTLCGTGGTISKLGCLVWALGVRVVYTSAAFLCFSFRSSLSVRDFEHQDDIGSGQLILVKSSGMGTLCGTGGTITKVGCLVWALGVRVVCTSAGFLCYSFRSGF